MGAQKPLWPWFVLIGGAIFLVSAGPGLLFTILLPFWRAEELGLFMCIFIMITVFTIIGTVWGMVKTYQALRNFNQPINGIPFLPEQQIESQEYHKNSPSKMPIWPWFIIVPGALLLVGSGPGVLMLPIMPLFLAGMSDRFGKHSRLRTIIHYPDWLHPYDWLHHPCCYRYQNTYPS
ncbi:MAG: hypothetical protein ACQEXB_22110 [Bacillota bacterium]